MKRVKVELHEVDGGYRAYVYDVADSGFDRFLFKIHGLDQHHCFQKIAYRWPFVEKKQSLEFLQRSLEKRD